MNCKKGDLAIVVKSVCGNEGKIVTCLELIDDLQWMKGDLPDGVEPGWIIDTELIAFDGSKSNLAKDSALRPIRDQPGEDETLTWAPVPHKETV